MKYKATLWLVLSFFVLLACEDKDDEIELQEGEVRYEVNFEMKWNQTSFPTDYPSNAHFSKLIGWSHQLGTNFFDTGSLATEGIKAMAEKGATSPLDSEIEAKIAANEGLRLFIGGGLGSGSGNIKMNVIIDKDNSVVSLVSMLAPSPDWYVGVLNVNLVEEGSFIPKKVVEAKVYDAGTDSGLSFSSADLETMPRENIQLFLDSPLGDGTKLNAVFAEVTFTKLN